MTNIETQRCPHCGVEMLRWITPEDSSWMGAIHLVCFNDDCAYFVKGWAHMMHKFEVRASYRHCLDPESGSSRPLPTWSKEAHREFIVPDTEGEEGSQ